VVAGRPWTRRLAFAVACRPGTVASKAARCAARPVVRRLLMMAGVAVAGWLLGVAGQAHADTVPGARLPSLVEQVEPVTAIADQVLAEPHVAPAVHRTGAVLAPARPPAILALPPAVTPAHAVVSRPRTPVGSAGPSRTRRHGGAGSRAGVSGGPVIHIGPHAVTGASEKASTDHVHVAHRAAHRSSTPRQPRPLPQRGQALPPSAGGDVAGGGVHPAGVRRRTEPGAVHRRPAFPVLRAVILPPVVRTAADEPSFSPD
jgi:hypothetical protein